MSNPLAHIYNYEAPDWAPLEAAVKAAGLPLETCGEFMWMCENPQGTHQYKHRDTRKYVHISGVALLLCPYHEDGLGWVECTQDFEGCEVDKSRKLRAVIVGARL